MTCGYASTIYRAAAVCVLSGLLVLAFTYWRMAASANPATITPTLTPKPSRSPSPRVQSRLASNAAVGGLHPSNRPPATVPIASTAPTTRPVPSPAAQARAQKLIREIFQADYRQTDPISRQTLAAKVLQQGIDTETDSTSRFVLFRESRDIAAAAGDAPAAARAIAMLERDFGIDPVPMTLAALTTAAGVARQPEAFRGIVRVAIAATDHAIVHDDYAAAFRLTTLAAQAAAKVRDEDLVRQIRDRNRDLQAMAAEYDRIKAARNVLQKNPRDPECSLVVGRYLCFTKSDFENGLALLAAGSDPTLRDIANAELVQPSDAAALLRIGNLWWEIAESQNPLAKSNLHQHARGFYQQAIGRVSGFELSVAEKRLELLEAEQMKQLRLVPGLHADLFKGIDFAQKVSTRVDPQINFDWGQDSPDPSLPKDNFSLRWTGRLKVPWTGRYELVAIANLGVRLWIDEQLVIDAPSISRQRNGVRKSLDLSAGLHTVRIDYWDTTATARVKLLWRPPRLVRDEPIPASSFFHEADANPSAAPQPE
ncbi:MAG: PA14 domain-containing protein [Bacillota bacterium]